MITNFTTPIDDFKGFQRAVTAKGFKFENLQQPVIDGVESSSHKKRTLVIDLAVEHFEAKQPFRKLDFDVQVVIKQGECLDPTTLSIVPNVFDEDTQTPTCPEGCVDAFEYWFNYLLQHAVEPLELFQFIVSVNEEKFNNY